MLLIAEHISVRVHQFWGTRAFSGYSPVFYALDAIGSSKNGKTKPSKVKDVVISWRISQTDLEVQKRKAIESILSRGHKLQVRVESKRQDLGKPLGPPELEARTLLLERLKAMAESCGGIEANKPEGSIYGRMMFYYRPK